MQTKSLTTLQWIIPTHAHGNCPNEIQRILNKTKGHRDMTVGVGGKMASSEQSNWMEMIKMRYMHAWEGRRIFKT